MSGRPLAEPRVLVEGLADVESPRWHEVTSPRSNDA